MKTKMQKYEWRGTAPNIQTFKVLKTLKVYNSPVRLFDCSVVRLFCICIFLKSPKPQVSSPKFQEAAGIRCSLKLGIWNLGLETLLLLFFLCQLPTANCSAQSDGVRIPSDQLSKVDSLLTAKENTNKVNALIELGKEMEAGSDNEKRISYSMQAKQLAEKLNYKKGMAAALFNLGNTYFDHANYPETLKNYFACLRLSEELNDKKTTAAILSNLGIVYWIQQDYRQSLAYYFRSLKIAQEAGFKKLEEGNYGNIGIVYDEQANYPQALFYHSKALKLARERGDKNGIARHTGNIGNVYKRQKEFAGALDYYFRALKMKEELDDKKEIEITLGNIGTVYLATQKYNEAEKFLQRALLLSDSLGDLEGEKELHENFSVLDSARGNFKGALEHYKKFISARDTINSDENQKKQVRVEMNYEFDKKEALAKAEQEKKDAVAAAEKKRQKIVLLFVVCGLLLVVAFAAFILRAFLAIKKKNKEISEQKRIIEEKQKDILDSIHYAARIQKCMMPNEKWIAKEIARLKAQGKK